MCIGNGVSNSKNWLSKLELMSIMCIYMHKYYTFVLRKKNI